ncbi:MAG: PhoX family phosphatase [Methylococcales bacterium]|nr:PhoX family phosphatase [Methylococcales bacterium]
MQDTPLPRHADNQPNFSEIVQINRQRRLLLQAGVALTGTSLLGVWTASLAAPSGPILPLLGFTALPVAQGGGLEPAISVDYQFDIILPWGDPLEPGGPSFQWPLDAGQQARQIGIGHDGMWFFPFLDTHAARQGWDDVDEVNPWQGRRMASADSQHGVLCLNHEFGTNAHVLGKSAPESLEEVRASQHAHGVSVIELACVSPPKPRWQTIKGLGRRIHVNSEVAFSGPAAGHRLLANPAGNAPWGTVGNCAMGYTPWGTYLTCEENFNGYFGTDHAEWTATPEQARYGINAEGFNYYWHRFDKRFDLAHPNYVNEANRFGWVVEIDPFDPAQTPVKRTALGRKKNESATLHVADNGQVVVYTGDDERFEYIYKFVSADDWRSMRRNGESPLDRGTLHVARFNDDGTGEWLPLTRASPVLAQTFADMGELLINARRAADRVGATPMDRPEWITVANDGRVYASLTNNSRRTHDGAQVINDRAVSTAPDAANPLVPNVDGHIIRWTETQGHAGARFTWDVFVFAQDTHGTEQSFADPDGLWADPDGRLFIETDGGQKDGLNNQLLVADTVTGEIKRLFSGVPGCEITGMTVTPDRRTLFVNIQHPGDGDPAVSNFPKTNGPDGVTVPRDATVVITRKNGGIVGS